MKFNHLKNIPKRVPVECVNALDQWCNPKSPYPYKSDIIRILKSPLLKESFWSEIDLKYERYFDEAVIKRGRYRHDIKSFWTNLILVMAEKGRSELPSRSIHEIRNKFSKIINQTQELKNMIENERLLNNSSLYLLLFPESSSERSNKFEILQKLTDYTFKNSDKDAHAYLLKESNKILISDLLEDYYKIIKDHLDVLTENNFYKVKSVVDCEKNRLILLENKIIALFVDNLGSPCTNLVYQAINVSLEKKVYLNARQLSKKYSARNSRKKA